jgi:hypothetical protein
MSDVLSPEMNRFSIFIIEVESVSEPVNIAIAFMGKDAFIKESTGP